ncbi:MAG: hypothetical protein GY820_38890 [Gammaproteobacteria bacterium]|nr:hypothetical protein [Gammaproteobacteria bacterium]
MGLGRLSIGTGSGALSESVSFGDSWKLVEVRLTLNTAATQEDFTITLNSAVNAVYDHNFLTNDMASDSDVRYAPLVPPVIMKGDVVDFAWTNTDGRTWALELIYEN